MTTQALSLLEAQLAAGNSERLTAFLRAVARFHRYSFGNVMLILSQRPDASRVAGFHTWKSLGRSAVKGERGIVIIAPMLLRSKQDADSSPDEPASDASAIRRLRLRFRAAYVFDIAQTDGQPLPEPGRVAGDPGAALARLERAVIGSGITLDTVNDLRNGVEGYSAGGRIVLRADQSDAERFSTLVHEWAHEILHHCQGEERPPKTVRETEAEAVAFIVGHAVGLELGTASSDYIRMYQGDAATLAASLDRVQRTACRITEAVIGDPPSKASNPSVDLAAVHQLSGRSR